ncbi:MAG: CRISPR-associated helicase Cas3' [Fibrobacteres bacterium]|nr:CRISPR-associated helicase Cas3' [Fibrobacterota bacterium]
MTTKIAHLSSNPDGILRLHLLEEHLRSVSGLAQNFTLQSHWKIWTTLASQLHDLGKYSDAFQDYIRKSNDFEEGETDNKPGRVEHAIIGAIYLNGKASGQTHTEIFSRLISYLIAGHHTGLPDWSSGEASGKDLEYRLQKAKDKKLLSEIDFEFVPEDILNITIPQKLPQDVKPENLHLWVRILFSCLVDADFLDTESFMDSAKSELRRNSTFMSSFLDQFNKYMHNKTSNAPDSHINKVRTSVLHNCRKAAKLSPGLFSLTVPTGGGKTLSSMAFALEHAVQHRKKRIIYAIPYTSIIEQTASIFKEIFGEENVIEHHSNTDPESETAKSKLASENWDTPIIITTNVQLFESLFAARSSRCRKLHNIVESVIILDEAQMLPPGMLTPILNVIRGLTSLFNVSFVLSTATQPALNKSDLIPEGLDGVREIIPNSSELYQQLKRVDIVMPPNTQIETYESITSFLCGHEQVLCIVNTRRDAWEIYKCMPAGTLHLSALMCGYHRSQIIATIKNRLKNGEPIRVISTQVVEAGVDIDFPVVYRAMAGLDSIAQAAGRCNREGKLKKGVVQVFYAPKIVPSGLQRKGADKTKEMLSLNINDYLSPSTFNQYFSLLYASINNRDEKEIANLLWSPSDVREGKLQFRTAANQFKLIEDGASTVVYVDYGDSKKWLNALRFGGPSRETMRKLQRFSVQVPPRLAATLLQQGFLEQLENGFLITRIPDIYDQKTGLQIFGKDYSAEELVI